MSKGLGKIELAVLNCLLDWDMHPGGTPGRDWKYRQEIASDVCGEDVYEPSRSQRESVNRAVRSLIRKGLVQEFDVPGVRGKILLLMAGYELAPEMRAWREQRSAS